MTFIYLFNSSATIVYWPNAMSLRKLNTLLKPIAVVANKQFRYICKTTKSSNGLTRVFPNKKQLKCTLCPNHKNTQNTLSKIPHTNQINSTCFVSFARQLYAVFVLRVWIWMQNWGLKRSTEIKTIRVLCTTQFSETPQAALPDISNSKQKINKPIVRRQNACHCNKCSKWSYMCVYIRKYQQGSSEEGVFNDI